MRGLSSSEKGSVVVEFALAFMVFWVCLLAVVEFSRLLFAWSTASEATRVGARLASICDMSSAQEDVIRTKVQYLVEASGLLHVAGNSNWMQFTRYPLGCDANSCDQVEVRLSGLQAQLNIPLLNLQPVIPDFRLRVPRESMKNIIHSENNLACS